MKLFVILIISLFSVHGAWSASAPLEGTETTIELPEVFSPIPELEEGLEVELNQNQISRILPWAESTRVALNDLIEVTENLPKRLREQRLLDGIIETVLKSAPRNTELLTRYVLNRAVKINEIIVAESNPDALGSIDARLRMLIQSIEFAQNYVKDDLAYLAAPKDSRPNIDFSSFGVTYFNFLVDLANSLADASAQYQVMRLSIGFLHWDLYRSIDRPKHGADILRIHQALKFSLPKNSPDRDQDSIAYIRSIKRIMDQLEVTVLRPTTYQVTQGGYVHTISRSHSTLRSMNYSDEHSIVVKAYIKNKEFVLTGNNSSDIFNKCTQQYEAYNIGSEWVYSAHVSINGNPFTDLRVTHPWKNADQACGSIEKLINRDSVLVQAPVERFVVRGYVGLDPNENNFEFDGTNQADISNKCYHHFKNNHNTHKVIVAQVNSERRERYERSSIYGVFAICDLITNGVPIGERVIYR